MENLAPPLQLLMALRTALHNGDSLRSGVDRFLLEGDQLFASDVKELMLRLQNGKSARDLVLAQSSLHRRASLELLLFGLKGNPIQAQLESLIAETKNFCEDEMKAFLADLPMHALVPLLLMQFPAFLILVFGPLMSRFLKELAQ